MSSHGVGLGPSKKGRTADSSMMTRNLKLVAQGQADATYESTQKKNPFRLASAILGGYQYNSASLARQNMLLNRQSSSSGGGTDVNIKLNDIATSSDGGVTYTLTNNYTIRVGGVLTIALGITFIVPAGKVLTNNGTIDSTAGMFTNNGTVTNNGTWKM